MWPGAPFLDVAPRGRLACFGAAASASGRSAGVRDCALFVVDDLAGSGYCYLRPDGRVELRAATSRRLATRLLTAALLSLPQGTDAYVSDLTAEQQWAVDVGLSAGLDVVNAGYVCLRGMRPPAPYVPSGTFLSTTRP